MAKAWISETQNIVQTEETMWNGMEKDCQEQYGMSRTNEYLHPKCTMFILDFQLWNA